MSIFVIFTFSSVDKWVEVSKSENFGLSLDNQIDISFESYNILFALASLFILKAAMAYQTLRQEYFQIPVVTRAYTTACVITTLSVVSMMGTYGNKFYENKEIVISYCFRFYIVVIISLISFIKIIQSILFVVLNYCFVIVVRYDVALQNIHKKRMIGSFT